MAGSDESCPGEDGSDRERVVRANWAMFDVNLHDAGTFAKLGDWVNMQLTVTPSKVAVYIDGIAQVLRYASAHARVDVAFPQSDSHHSSEFNSTSQLPSANCQLPTANNNNRQDKFCFFAPTAGVGLGFDARGNAIAIGEPANDVLNPDINVRSISLCTVSTQSTKNMYLYPCGVF